MPSAAGGSGSEASDPAAAAARSGGTKRRRRGPRYQRSFVSAPEVDLRSTESRYRLRDWIAHRLRRGNGRGPAVCGCGLPAYDIDEIEWCVARSGRARPANTLRCKSAIVCPVCAVSQGQKLQIRLQEVVDLAIARGGSVGMQTLTLRHNRGHELKHLRQVTTEAFRRVESGRGWLKLKREGGLLGQAKVLEVPWGPAHGWHPHLHLLLVFDHRDDARARSAAAALEVRWIHEVTALGFEALPAAQDFKPCYDAAGAAGYCAKLAAELAHGWAKQRDYQDRHALVGIFTLAGRAMAGDQEADRLFLEYADSMSGLQQGRVSKPLREALKITERQASEAERPKIAAKRQSGANRVSSI
jgi:Replication protein